MPRKKTAVPRAPDAIPIDELVPIANKLRSCALVLKTGGTIATPVAVIEEVIEQIDRWEAEVARG